MNGEKHTLLIIEDDLDVAEMLHTYFQMNGYDVITANWGEDGVRAAMADSPDVIILDVRLPDIDGFEVAARLRAAQRTRHIPIIFLTEKRQRLDRLKGLELGADDYITKPFDIPELKLRVRNTLRRATQSSFTNPVTRLPEGILVDERLEAARNEPAKNGLLIVRINHLDHFRESYGFVASDDVLRAISLIIQDALQEQDGQDDFIGHLSAVDFLILTPPASGPALAEKIEARISQSIDLFYPAEHRNRPDSIAQRLDIRIGLVPPQQIGAAADLQQLKKLLEDSLA